MTVKSSLMPRRGKRRPDAARSCRAGRSSRAEAAMRTIEAGVLETAYVELGPGDGWPVVLSHRFPFDVHACDAVAPALAEHGARVIVPYLRGSGPTRFHRDDTPRSGQQAALGRDLVALPRCTRDREGDPGRLRLGRPGILRRDGVAARARRGAGVARELRHHRHRPDAEELPAGDRARRLVSASVPERTRPGGPGHRSARALPLARAPAVARPGLRSSPGSARRVHGRRADARGLAA